MDTPTVTAIVFRQGSLWVAQCLEINIAVSAESRADLPRTLRQRLQGQMLLDLRRGIAPFSQFGQARRDYWELLDRAEPWMSEEVPEPFLARVLRALRHLDSGGRRLELAQVAP